MRCNAGVFLIVMGALVVLVPVVATAYAKNANKDHIAEFYSRNGFSVPLPDAMEPASGDYDWACWIAGVGMVVAGARLNCSCPKPAGDSGGQKIIS
jgi:hypothetical protein